MKQVWARFTAESRTLGDYVVNLGQGLIQRQALGFGKTTEIVGIKRQSPILLAYRSPGEYAFNRGAGVTGQYSSNGICLKTLVGILLIQVMHFPAF